MSKSLVTSQEMRIGMNGTHAFMVFTPPLSENHSLAVDTPSHPAESSKTIELKDKRRQLFTFPRGTFGWNERERETAFQQRAMTIASHLKVAKLEIGSMELESKTPISQLFKTGVEVTPVEAASELADIEQGRAQLSL